MSAMLRRLLLLLALVLATAPASAAGGIVSAADPRAAEAGREMLRAGGSATDAAMAMMLVLGVVEPQASGIGGGGFLLHSDGGTGQLTTIDGRETAPAAARPDRFLGPDGKPLAFVDAWQSGLSVGVPGNIRLMALAHARWGKLVWAKLFAPAIRLAEQGFIATPRLEATVGTVAPRWIDFPAIHALYASAGTPTQAGETVTNPALAATLRRIAAGGAEAFYGGETGTAIAAAVSHAPRHPVPLTLADLAAYRAKERPAICGAYRGYKVCGMGPPSSGAITVLQILAMVERFDMKRLGKDSPVAWHVLAEAMQLAFADRDLYLGDSDFVTAPVAGLLDRDYLAGRSRLISATHALGSYPAGTPPGAASRIAAGPPADEHGTTNFVAVDGKGEVVTMTSTVESVFGSQLVAAGMVLNNELTDFSFVPDKDGVPLPNRVEPGKRPLSSMAPTIVYDAQGRAIFTVGAGGGRSIIMQVAKTLIAHLDWGLPAEEAIATPVIFFNAQGLVIEDGSRLAMMRPALERLGHVVTPGTLPLKTNAAERTASGWHGAADPRGEGVALAE